MSLATIAWIGLVGLSLAGVLAGLLTIRARRWRQLAVVVAALAALSVALLWVAAGRMVPSDECTGGACAETSDAALSMMVFAVFIIPPLGALLVLLAFVVHAMDGLGRRGAERMTPS